MKDFKNIFKYLMLLLMPMIIIIISNIFFSLYNNLSLYGFVTLNEIPSCYVVYSFFFFLKFCFNSLKKANYTINIFFFIFTIINQIKIYYMQEPIYLSDIMLLSGTGDVYSMINDSLINFFTNNIILLLIHFSVFIAIHIILNKIDEKSFQLKRNYIQLIVFILFIVLSLPIKKTTNIMQRILYGNMNAYKSIVDKVQYSCWYGLVGALYGNMLENRIFVPDNYKANEETINNILNENIKMESKTDNPNIILLFSESFFDITKIGNDIVYSYDILEDYHNLSKENKLIQIISPTYGGMSSNVEFELLTGFNLAYYSNSYIPYLNLINKEFLEKENLLSILKLNGYKNYYFYATSDNLYNVGKVSEYLGFIKNNNNTNIEKKGIYVSDKYVTDTIIDLIDKEENSVFYLAETMQSHMPYTKDKYDNYNVNIDKSNLSQSDEEIVLSYSEGIHDASVELKRLYDYLKKCKEDAIVIFLGDHLPYIQNEKGENIVDKISYFNTPDSDINLYRRYNTEALILANFDIKFDETKYLSPDLLLPYVLKSIDIPMTPYYNYLINKSKNVLPCYNKYIYANSNGDINLISTMKGDVLKEYELRETLQYKLYYMK